MTPKVKTPRRSDGRSRISNKHQITIPISAFSEAGLREGDVVHVAADGRGRLRVTRMQASSTR